VTFENTTETVDIEKEEFDPDPTYTNLIGEEGRSKEAHSITDFLATPRLPSQGVITWTTAQSVGTEIGFLPFPQVFFQSDMVRKKISNFRFLYPGISCIRLVVNANRFAVGRLLLVWEPCPNQRGYMSPIDEITSWSAYPHAEYDVGFSNEITMKMPFVADRLWYDLVSDNFQYGGLRVFVLNQLRVASGSNNANVKIWCWLEDVQIAVRTYNPNSVLSIETQAFRDYRERSPTVDNHHRRKIKYKSSESNTMSRSGVISGPLWMIGRAAGAAAKVIPAPYSFIGNAIEWASKLGSYAASALGYSRPQSHRVVTPMVEYPGLGYTNYNGLENGAMLAADALNSLNVDHTVFGTTADEMDISYICSQSCFLENLTWSTVDTPNTILGIYNVNPGLSRGTASANVFTPTLLAYVASMFRYWRGSIQFDFSVVGNAFYSGTLGFTYVPGIFFPANPTHVTNDMLETLPRMICDLRETTECSVTCDFTSKWEYLRTYISDEPPYDVRYCTGTLICYVVNPLVAPDTVPSTIDINVWVCSKEMEFAIPTNYQESQRRIPNRTGLPNFADDEIETQGLDDSAPEGIVKPDNHTHDFVSMVSDSTLAAQLCIGEKITNLRQLTRRFGYLGERVIGTDPSECNYLDAHYINFDDPSYNCEAPYAYIAQIYAFFRGSMKYKLYSLENGDHGWIRAIVFSKTTSPTREGSFDAQERLMRFEHTHFLHVNPFMEFTVPYYTNVHVRLLTNAPRNVASNIPAFYSNEERNTMIYSALGDDSSFGYLVGPPYIRIA